MNAKILAAALLLAGCSPAAESDKAAAPAEATLAAPADAGAPVEAPPSLVVRFRATHALGRAQALEAQGRCAEAAELARATLAADAELQGLCFDRFTAGGAEIVLEACDPVAAIARETFLTDWAARLRAMPAVEYADPNVVADIGGCRG